ncbi:hypothetical protein [Pseudomonas phage vB_PseuGesM_254]|uniref:Uncharacterized protein n=1 Tax=Pseudomonas phage vB_PseuGesM_254 TaxID=3092638 RepID=A0AAX4G6V1_9CAUD|nr:hypothetical protein [Pseudomonas phage PseuGes_254]
MSGIKNVGYVIHVTEFESGWGSRPDGYFISLDLVALENKCRQVNDSKGSEFSRADFKDKKMVQLNQETVDKLTDGVVLWTGNNLKNYVEAN